MIFSVDLLELIKHNFKMMEINISEYLVKENSKIKLKDLSTNPYPNLKRKKIKNTFSSIIKDISKWQEKLYADDNKALLIIFQGIDASGKDSSICEIFKGVNPQGVNVHSFKTPTSNDYAHNYLWRHVMKLPEKGQIGVFNRSHYENVLVCRVHPEFILKEKLPHINSIKDINDNFFDIRYKEINSFEKTLNNTGTTLIKFFLNISKDEQKKRFIKRMEEEQKNWKFSTSDLKEREHWDEYQKAFEKALNATSTKECPWYIIPSDNKAFSQLLMAKIIEKTLIKMKPEFPKISSEIEKSIDEYKILLKSE